MLLKVQFAEVEVYQDVYDQGEKDYVNSWSIDEIKGMTFKTAADLVQAINYYSGIFSDKIEDYVYIDGRIDTDAFVNEDNDEPTPAEIQIWRNGELMLYNAHLLVGLCLVPENYEEDFTEERAEEYGFSIY